MTLSNLVVKDEYTGDASTTSFTITFDVLDNTYIQVYVRDESVTPATEALKVLTTDYTLTGDPATAVNFVTAPVATDVVVIRRTLPLTQGTDYLETGAFQAQTHEDRLDKIQAQIQQLNEEISRCLRVPITNSDTSPEIGEPVGSGFLQVNSGVTAFQYATEITALTSPLTTKGDILVHDGSGIARIGIGSDNQALIADSGETAGLKWGPAGGGGGAGAVWHSPVGGPIEDEENGATVYLFEVGQTQTAQLFLKVPQSYLAGNAIVARLAFYTPSSSNVFEMRLVTTLIEQGSDAITTTGDQKTTDSSDITNTVVDQYREITFAVTDASGEINSTAVAAGDIIKFELSRITPVGTDDTADIRFIPSATEVTFS